MEIREEEAGDAGAIRAVVEAAFGRPDEADLVDRLRTDGDSVISLVAVEQDRAVGHILFSRMEAPFPALGLAPVSVVPERQRAGIGSRLIRTGLAMAEQGGWRGVFVLGDPAYYQRFGFDPEPAAGFSSPYAGPYFMAQTWGPDLPAVGVVEYAPAFGAAAGGDGR